MNKENDKIIIGKTKFGELTDILSVLFGLSLVVFGITKLEKLSHQIAASIFTLIASIVFLVNWLRNRKNKRPFLTLDKNGILISERKKEDRFHHWIEIRTIMKTNAVFNNSMNFKVLVIISKKTGEKIDSIELRDFNIEPHEMKNALYDLSGQHPIDKIGYNNIA